LAWAGSCARRSSRTKAEDSELCRPLFVWQCSTALWRRGGVKVAVRTGGDRMSGQVIIQYATLMSLGVGILGLGIAVLIHLDTPVLRKNSILASESFPAVRPSAPTLNL
jgi:hypothetical protein